MKLVPRLAAKGLFSAGVLGVLVFGAMQATATPARAAAPQCEPATCDESCRLRGAAFGYCGPFFTGCICEY